MAKTLIVGTESFEFPVEGDLGNYGEEITDWAEAVSTALGTVQQRNDIPITTASILNNITTATAIPGFSFDTTEVISVQAEYIVRRNTTVPANNLVASGTLMGNFDGSTWYITIRSIKDAGIELDINSSGQVTYTSSDISGSNYSGEILFKAKVFNQPE